MELLRFDTIDNFLWILYATFLLFVAVMEKIDARNITYSACFTLALIILFHVNSFAKQVMIQNRASENSAIPL